MKITPCENGFVAEIKTEEDFNKMMRFLSGEEEHKDKFERIDNWVDKMYDYIYDNIPDQCDGAELPYMYALLSRRLLDQVVDWAGDDVP